MQRIYLRVDAYFATILVSEVQFVLGGGIQTKVVTCSNYEIFEYERSSYFLISAATEKNTEERSCAILQLYQKGN
jgi:hypothetical protein